MNQVPAAVAEQIENVAGQFKHKLSAAKDAQLNSENTRSIISEMLENIFGYHKTEEINLVNTAYQHLSGIVVSINSRVQFLLINSSVGEPLAYDQTIFADMAREHDTRWLILTNGIQWRVLMVPNHPNSQPELVYQFNFLDIETGKPEQKQLLFTLSKRGMQRDLLKKYYDKNQFVNQYTISAIITTDKFINLIRRELCHIQESWQIDSESIKKIISEQLIGSDILQSEAGKHATLQVNKLLELKENEKVSSRREKAAQAMLSKMFDHSLKY